ncbi:hypothetical protein HN587_01835 [Candidatus Woesearchaeota archaeon]|jgi:hypothetical protein|nr:hypothetical protein [Candidatus Woesearchaeota archaeon]
MISNKKNRTLKNSINLILSLFLIIILSGFVCALGVTPAKTNFYQGQKPYVGEFKVIPSSDKSVIVSFSVDDELGEYVTLFETEKLIDGPTKFKFELSDPQNLKTPGNHLAKIRITEKSEGEGMTSVNPSIHHTVNFFVPYPSKYLETDLLVFNDHPHLVKFTTVMENKGSEPITHVQNFVDVVSYKHKVASLYKANLINGNFDVVVGYSIVSTSEPKILSTGKKEFEILPGEKFENQLSLKKVLMSDGEYQAVSYVIFNDEEVELVDEFRLGEENILIVPQTRTVGANDTSKISILLSSNWNVPLNDVYLSGKMFKGDSLLDELVESSRFEVLPNKTVGSKLYWDTKGYDLGEYTLNVVAHYGEKTFEKSIPILVVPKDQVVEVEDREPTSFSGLIMFQILLVIIILITTLVIVLMKRKGF